MNHILLIEDDKALSNGIKLALQSETMEVTMLSTLCDARSFELSGYDLIILDINLPDGNGLDFLEEVKRKSSISVILLTANDLETDVVAGLEMGADDYITKPFSLAILRARVNARLRSKRQEGMPHKDGGFWYQTDEYSFDFEDMIFKIKEGGEDSESRQAERQVELSKTEQKLLRMLIENKGAIIERGRLIDYIWPDGVEYVDENALSVTVKRLRDKLEEHPSAPSHIRTVYGIGYRWEDTV